jgi:hypothetical protein
LIVIVELPEPGAGIVLGLKLTVVPAGAPEAERLTAAWKLPTIVVVRVACPAAPVARPIDGGRVNMKFGCTGAVTVSSTGMF